MEVQERVPVQVLPLVLPLVLRKGFQRIRVQKVRQGLRVLRRAMSLRIPASRVRSVSRRVDQKAVHREGPRGVRLEDLTVVPTAAHLEAPRVGHLEDLKEGRRGAPRVGLWAEKRVFRSFPRSRSRSLRWPHPRSCFLPFVPPRPGIQGPRCRQKHRPACSQVGNSLLLLGLFQQKFSV